MRPFTPYIVILLLTLSWSQYGSANDDFFAAIEVTDNKNTSDHWINGNGFIQQKIKYGMNTPDNTFNFERNETGVTQIQTDILGEIEGDISSIVRVQIGAKAEINALRWEQGEQIKDISHSTLLLKDAFFDITFNNGHWLRLGHQIFAWGESETLAITDVIAPTDQREFGQTELQDIREHVPAVLYSLPTNKGKLSFVTTYAAGRNRYAQADEEFYPYISLKNSPVTLKEITPDKRWEVAIKYDIQFNGGDVSIVAADTNTNDLFIEGAIAQPNTLNLVQKRVRTLGIAANRVHKSWLLKSELGINWNQPVATPLGHTEEDQARMMLGAEFSGINNWLFRYELTSIISSGNEATNQHHNTSALGQTLHIQYKAMNERLTQDFWLFDLLDNNGAVMRYNVTYNWTDSWAFSGAVVLYTAPDQDAELYPFRKNDTLNLSAKYSF